MKLISVAIFIGLASLGSTSAHAMELDWSGQFRSEFNYIRNYNLDSTAQGLDPLRLYTPPAPPATAAPGANRPMGYYIPSGGSNNASFETLFLKLKPKLVVNDNIYIKSEWWVGDPVFGFYGNAYPYTFDQRQFYSNQSRGSAITAQRVWAEFLSDFGTIQVGRAPLDYGLGLVWNAGDGVFDHYESTGDVVRLVSKFGAFTFSPAFITYSTGNTFGGACVYDPASGICSPSAGSGGITDYSILLKYENLEEDFEGGLNFVRRIAGGAQDLGLGVTTPVAATGPGAIGDSNSGMQGPVAGSSGAAYNIWDIYAKKKLGRLTLAVEAPVVSGELAGIPYSTWAVGAEADWKINETWETQVKLGHVPGQPSSQYPGFDTFSAFYFNPNYRLGTIMFNYALQNLGGYSAPNTQNNPAVGPQNQGSPYDNPMTNVNYLSWMGLLHADKWTFDTGLIYAHAVQEAQNGSYYYNQWYRTLDARAVSPNSQGGSYGLEWDAGVGFQWDEFFICKLDLAMFFPGDFYKFSNVAGIENGTSTVMAGVLKVGVTF